MNIKDTIQYTKGAKSIKEIKDDSLDEEIIPPPPTRSSCEICSLDSYKYTCPACLIKTCSLKCCNYHKAQTNCTGKYRHSKYIGISDMNEKAMKKDINFLATMIENTESIKKKLSILKRGSEQMRFKLLKIYAKKLHNINIKYAPSIMTRHRENLSFYHTKSRKIFWTLEFVIKYEELDGSPGNITVRSKPIEENAILCDILCEVAQQCETKLNIILIEKFGKSDLMSIIRDGLIKFWLKNEDVQKGKNMIAVDWGTEISILLKDQVIIEYPSFVIKIK